MANPLPNPDLPMEQQADEILLAMCLWGEARGQHDDAKLGVGNVIRNRMLAGRYGADKWAKVILAPLQFSSFNSNDVNRTKLLRPLEHGTQAEWDACYGTAMLIIDGMATDNTQRATHYFDRSLDANPPLWAKVFTHTCDIDGLHFYRDPKAFQPTTHLTDGLLGGNP